MSGETVLVTGGSGFIGSYCILDLLRGGHRVRTTVRAPGREATVRELLGAENAAELSFATADLTSDEGWPEAVAGCEYVLHVASPFPLGPPKHEDDLIVPAREGALRVLRAAREAGVRRVVLTSSFAAIGYGGRPRDRPFTEEDWTNPDGEGVSAYAKSKTLAERAAWDFVQSDGGGPELAVVNPVGVFGPVLGPDYSTSIQLIKRLIEGAMPGLPNVAFGIVDVRDVADLHVRAMTAPEAAGERFLAIAGTFMTVPEIAATLRERMGEDARKVPTRRLPDWLVRLVAVFDSSVKQITPELGKVKQASNEKAKRLLGWSPRTNEEAIVATGESLVRLGARG
ncbi:MAG: aldehyde reductase [Thermoleophilaceae bacterium]|nr:aldehyde reductase [Thermoleophilaceae bacterium]